MAIPEKELSRFRKALKKSQKPIFFFDNDPDGLCSFLLLYRYIQRGRGIPVKTTPGLQPVLLRKVEEHCPDAVFILDVAIVDQAFLDGIEVPVYWLDHHKFEKQQIENYFNPLIGNKKDERPTSLWAYKIVKQDLWIAMTGMVGDWFLPKFKDKFVEQYPHLLKPDVDTPEKALFESRIGQLSRIFSFNLQGKHSDVMAAIKIMTRIEDPEEIMKKKTAKGRFVYRRYERIDNIYQQLLNSVDTSDEKMIVHIYEELGVSLTAEISNELLYRFPKRVNVIARERNNEMKCSLRGKQVNLLKIIKKALTGVEGYGGGHVHACGACIKKTDFKKFLKNIRKQL